MWHNSIVIDFISYISDVKKETDLGRARADQLLPRRVRK